MRHPRPVSAALLVALLSATAFWTQHARTTTAKRDLAVAASSRRYPFLMHGLRLPIPTLVQSVPMVNGSNGFSRANRRFIVAVSDKCAFSRDLQPKICELLHTTPLTADDEIDLISFSGTETITQLASCVRNGESRAVVAGGVVRRTTEFTLRTGIIATPSFVVADDAWSVQHAYSVVRFDEWRADLTGHKPQ